MTYRGSVALVVGALALALAGCGAGAEAAAAVYDECASPDSDINLVRHDGDEVMVDVRGDHARAIAGMEGWVESVESGSDPSDAQSDGLAVGFSLMMAVDCLVEETAFPGSSVDLEDGDEWEGWRYSYERGAGSEETYIFTATQ